MTLLTKDFNNITLLKLIPSRISLFKTGLADFKPMKFTFLFDIPEIYLNTFPGMYFKYLYDFSMIYYEFVKTDYLICQFRTNQ